MVDKGLDRMDDPSVEVVDRKRFPTSVYTASDWDGKMLVGGSDWDRRRVPYSQEVAEQSRGSLRVLGQDGEEERVVDLPSMVYSVVPVPERGVAFVGCRSAQGMLNVVDEKGEVLRSVDDLWGKGVYNATYNPRNGLMLCTKRSGWVVSINLNDLNEVAGAKLTQDGVRLWSLAYDRDRDVIYAGDYDGCFYAVTCREGKIGYMNLQDLYAGEPEAEDLRSQGVGPSLWGLEVLSDGNIALGDRWGGLTLVSPEVSSGIQVLSRVRAPDGVTCLLRMEGDLLLVGTRVGKLYSFDFGSGEFKLVVDIPPVLQGENAIWGMSRVSEKEALVSVADGEVVRVKVSV